MSTGSGVKQSDVRLLPGFLSKVFCKTTRFSSSATLPDNPKRYLISSSIIIVLTLNLTSIMYNIATTKDVIAALDSSLILMGLSLVAFKYYDFHQNSSAILKLCGKVITHYKKVVADIHPVMRKKFRVYFIVNSFFNYIWGMSLGVQLFSALIFQAVIYWGETLPMPARYPFLEISSMKVFLGVALFQSGMYAFNLFLIVIVDSTIVCIIFYVFVFFKFLHHKCAELDNPGISDVEARQVLKEIILEHQTLIE